MSLEGGPGRRDDVELPKNPSADKKAEGQGAEAGEETEEETKETETTQKAENIRNLVDKIKGDGKYGRNIDKNEKEAFKKILNEDELINEVEKIEGEAKEKMDKFYKLDILPTFKNVLRNGNIEKFGPNEKGKWFTPERINQALKVPEGSEFKKTLFAVARFQKHPEKTDLGDEGRKFSLDVDGFVGPKTMEALEALEKKQAEAQQEKPAIDSAQKPGEPPITPDAGQPPVSDANPVKPPSAGDNGNPLRASAVPEAPVQVDASKPAAPAETPAEKPAPPAETPAPDPKTK